MKQAILIGIMLVLIAVTAIGADKIIAPTKLESKVKLPETQVMPYTWECDCNNGTITFNTDVNVNKLTEMEAIAMCQYHGCQTDITEARQDSKIIQQQDGIAGTEIEEIGKRICQKSNQDYDGKDKKCKDKPIETISDG